MRVGWKAYLQACLFVFGGLFSAMILVFGVTMFPIISFGLFAVIFLGWMIHMSAKVIQAHADIDARKGKVAPPFRGK